MCHLVSEDELCILVIFFTFLVNIHQLHFPIHVSEIQIILWLIKNLCFRIMC